MVALKAERDLRKTFAPDEATLDPIREHCLPRANNFAMLETRELHPYLAKLIG
jgi:hypothetical protein